ncbi:MAG: hypothetical protein GY850_35125 [bacterium]|nr:hypothetical protein [bacterium]
MERNPSGAPKWASRAFRKPPVRKILPLRLWAVSIYVFSPFDFWLSVFFWKFWSCFSSWPSGISINIVYWLFANKTVLGEHLTESICSKIAEKQEKGQTILEIPVGIDDFQMKKFSITFGIEVHSHLNLLDILP